MLRKLKNQNAALVAERLRVVTDAAAVAAAPWIGTGPEFKNHADQAAVDAMHEALGRTGLSCIVVIGEGEKDNAPELRQGLVYGKRRQGPRYGLAVDPIEGTSFVAHNQPGAMSIAALGNRLLPWTGIPYMKKLVVGPRAAECLADGSVRLDGDPAVNMKQVAEALDKPPSELTVAMLDRPRNSAIEKAAREIGARVKLLQGGDVLPALQALHGKDVDMLYSSGGAPEGVITAAAIAGRGNMQAMMDPQTDAQWARAMELGLDGRVLNVPDLVGDGEVYFSATGITASDLLGGCAQDGRGNWLPGENMLSFRGSA